MDNFNGLEANREVAILGYMFELGAAADKEHQHIADHAASLDIVDTVYLVGENFFKITTDSLAIKQFKTFNELKSELEALAFKNPSLLIKGSRGMALE